jgi:hypothetical protein
MAKMIRYLERRCLHPLPVPFYDIEYSEKLHGSISLNPATKVNLIPGGINKIK